MNRFHFLCHPERTRISYLTALTGATFVVLPKENHMQLTEATTLDRKSGEAEGSAVRHSCAPLLPAHNRHQASPNPHGKTNLPFVIPGFQEWSAEPQVPRLRS